MQSRKCKTFSVVAGARRNTDDEVDTAAQIGILEARNISYPCVTQVGVVSGFLVMNN